MACHHNDPLPVPPWLQSLPLAPEFRPSLAEFSDPIAYISKIEPQARSFGICKIIPPFPPLSKKMVMANLDRSLLLGHSSHSLDIDVRTSASSAVRRRSELDSASQVVRSFIPPPVVSTGMTERPLSSKSQSAASTCDNADSCGLKGTFTTVRQQLGRSDIERTKRSLKPFAQKLVWEDGERYTLEQFEDKAVKFARVQLKASNNVPPLALEALFWKAAADSPITVEYGSGISGSAFEVPSSNVSLTSKETPDVHAIQTVRKESELELPETQAHLHETAKKLDYQIESSIQVRPNYPGACSISTKDGLLRRRRSGLQDADGSRLANSSWNMRVLPRARGSLLRYLPDEIPGVTSPMVYIGMLFSWFAWHVEDHELHGANYLHMGAPKTWYAVPGDAAPALEEVIRVYGYENISDPKVVLSLLCEKTTIMSPEVLVAAGVPCCRLVQNAGDFVITFPRAYHLGFSHGFNCGEAANFASPSWLEVAKEAATRRALLNLLPMFSHQQLLYLLAFSIPPRISFADSVQLSSSISEDRRAQLLGEDAVKTAFVNDVAHVNRLLGLLLDTGITGCIVLRDDIDFSSVSSRQIKHSCNDCKTSCCAMSLNGYCETPLSDNSQQKDVLAKMQKYQFFVKTTTNKRRALQEEFTICRPPFRWRTLTCAACGLMCFPAMAVVKPAAVVINGSNCKKYCRENISQQLSSARTDKTPPLVVTALPFRNRSVNEGDDTFKNDENQKETFISESPPKLTEFDDPLPLKQLSEEELLTTVKMFIGPLSSYGWTVKEHGSLSSEKDDGDAVTVNDKNHISVFGKNDSPLVNEERNPATCEPVFQDLLSVLDPLVASYQEYNEVYDNNNGKIAERPVHEDIYFHPRSSLMSDGISYKLDGPFCSSMHIRQHAQFLVKDSQRSKDDIGIEMKAINELDNRVSREAWMQSNHNTCAIEDYTPKMESLSVYAEATIRDSHDLISVSGKLKNSQPVSKETGTLLRPLKALAPLLPNCFNGQNVQPMTSLLKDNKVEIKEASQSNFVKGQSQILHDSVPSETELRPCFLCLEHALEARSRLKSLGGSYVVLFCHSDMAEMEHCAKSFAEELCLPYSWRHILFRQASCNEENLLKTAFSVAYSKESTGDDWLARLGMTVLRNGSRILLRESGSLYEDPSSSSMTKDCNLKDQRNKVVPNTNNKCKRDRHSDASGMKTNSVAGEWCGNVWMSSQVHPILRGCPSSKASLQILNLSVGECVSNSKIQVEEGSNPESLKSTNSGSPKSAMEGIGETNHASAFTGLELKTPMLRKLRSVQEVGNPSGGCDVKLGATINGRKISKKEGDGMSKDSAASPASAAAIIGYRNNDVLLPMVPDFGSKEAQKRGLLVVDHGDSDADIWQDIDDVYDQMEIIPSDDIKKVQGPSLMDVSEVAVAQLQDDLLLPVTMRRRNCCISDGRISAHTICEKIDCIESQSVEWVMRPTLYTAVGSGIMDERKYMVREDSAKQAKEDGRCSSKSLSDVFWSGYSAKMQEGLSLERAGNYTETPPERGNEALLSRACSCLNEDSSGNSRPWAIGASGISLPQRASRPLEFATRKSRSMNSDSIHGKWRSMSGGERNTSKSLVQCSNMNVAGKRSHKQLQDIVKAEVTGSSDDEKIPCKKFVTNGRCYEDRDTGGPSTRLRPRSSAKLIGMDDEEISDVQEHARRTHKPRQSRRKKPAARDADDFGAYYCDIEGCTMTFDTKQELKMHKRNVCVYAGCGKRFGSHKYLLQHRRVHLDDRPLKCPWNGCQMTFKWKWACTEHYRVHTGERPYVCPVAGCGRSFRFVSDFSRHKRKTGHAK